jgi:hydroxypyruvate reductase
VNREILRKNLTEIFSGALQAVLPDKAVKRHLSLEGSVLRIGSHEVGLDHVRRILVVGFGKASAAMAREVENILGERIDAGVVVTKYGHGLPLKRIRVMEAGHPVPDENGVRATREILDLVDSAARDDVLLCLISGGGSALMVQPREGLTLADKQQVTQLMLRGGVPIEEMNIVRKHMSAVKGGQLARLAMPARVFSLIISDVIGDLLESIASGPTAPDPSSFADAVDVLQRYEIWNELPETVRQWFEKAAGEPKAETPKPGDPLFDRVENLIIASNRSALQEAEQLAAKKGFNTLVLSSSVKGEAREIAHFFGAIAREIRQTGQPLPTPACVLAGGETTVTVRGDGKGGRNTEMALAILEDLQGLGKAAFLSAGTDGTDGPTDAAGAFAFPDSLERGRQKGLEWRHFLRNNDSYSYFDRLGDLLRTGPTGTNVMDLQILLVL